MTLANKRLCHNMTQARVDEIWLPPLYGVKTIVLWYIISQHHVGR
jgi:hypothetical protein